MSDRIAVIGAGHNGLTAAAILARAGREVVVLESRPIAGGLAAREEFHDRFFSAGLLHHTSGVRPRLIESLELARFGLEWRDSPDVWAPGPEGRELWIRGDEIAGDIAAGDDERFGRHRAFIARVARAMGPVMDAPPPDPAGPLWPLLLLALGMRRLGSRDMNELLRIAAMPAADWMGDSFEGERLRAAVAATALEGTFAGPRSPHSAGTLLIRECMAGREVMGGPAALTRALGRAAHSHGAVVRTGSRVAAISLSGDGAAVRGVELEGGERIEAGVVVASCDPRTTFLGLVGARNLPARLAAAIERIRARGTTAKMHLAIKGQLTARDGRAVEALRTGATLDDLERAFDAIKYGEVSPRPALDVRVPSMSDPGLCPEGHQVVSILAHFAPYDVRGGWDDEQRQALGQAIVDALVEHAPDLGERIVAREVLSPADIEARYGACGGHVHHGEPAPDQLLFMRPTLECAKYATPIAGLYLAGSGSHPGGGVTCAPGALAARAILRRR